MIYQMKGIATDWNKKASEIESWYAWYKQKEPKSYEFLYFAYCMGFLSLWEFLKLSSRIVETKGGDTYETANTKTKKTAQTLVF